VVKKLPDCLRRAYGSSLHYVALRMTSSYKQIPVMLSKAKHLVIFNGHYKNYFYELNILKSKNSILQPSYS